MTIINVTNPLTLILLVVATVLLIFLGKEVKKPYIAAIALGFFLILILMHSYQLIKVPAAELPELHSALLGCLTVDFIMIFVTFFAYLWIDDIAAKFYKKKSIDDSLNWFWDKV